MNSLRSTFNTYNERRSAFIDNPVVLISAERVAAEIVASALVQETEKMQLYYDGASSSFSFWKNYPPGDRGRLPRGDQYPWIEVGEHTIGVPLIVALGKIYDIQHNGFPIGPDQRIIIKLPTLRDLSLGLIDAVWLNIDIKSAGPRDDFPHIVMSPNQISGSGEWRTPLSGVSNQPIEALGVRSSHAYQPMLPPLLILSDGTVAVTVTIVIKPIYGMSHDSNGN